MTQPPELATNKPLVWSAGRGLDLWNLFRACIRGDLKTVRRLLARDPSLARAHFHYRKPLYFAVRENRLQIAELLFDLDPDPLNLAFNDSLLEIATDRGYPEMHALLRRKLAARNVSPAGEPAAAAIRDDNLPRLKTLLDQSPELLHAGDERGNQPIHWAAMTRRHPIIDELHRRGADLNAQRLDGARPIQITGGDYHFRNWGPSPGPRPRETITHLRSLGAHCDICTAAHIGDLKQIRALLRRDPTLVNRLSDYPGYYSCSGAPLRNAASAGHLQIVKFLLKHGADPNLPEEGLAPRGKALYLAATNGHYEIAKLLLAAGAHPNAEVESSADTLSRVLSNQDDKMRDLLLEHGAARPVHLLAAFNDLQTAAAVFHANPALAHDPDALANAASAGHESFVRLMLRYQPKLPLAVRFPSWAVAGKTKTINHLLFQHGMDPSAPNWLGITPLHQFARSGDTAHAEQFIAQGANLHARDEDICSTPLGWAAKFGQLKMAKLLLKHGAKINHPDDPEWATPKAWATRRHHPQILKLFKS